MGTHRVKGKLRCFCECEGAAAPSMCIAKKTDVEDGFGDGMSVRPRQDADWALILRTSRYIKLSVTHILFQTGCQIGRLMTSQASASPDWKRSPPWWWAARWTTASSWSFPPHLTSPFDGGRDVMCGFSESPGGGRDRPKSGICGREETGWENCDSCPTVIVF